jgi:hypothetical protein
MLFFARLIKLGKMQLKKKSILGTNSIRIR